MRRRIAMYLRSALPTFAVISARKTWLRTPKEALARKRRRGDAIVLVDLFRTRQFEQRRGKIHDMTNVMAEIPTARQPSWPMDDERSGHAAFIDPDFESAKRRVRDRRPTAAQA